MDTLKARLKNMELTFGSWITVGHPIVAEIMSKAGFDWLVVDMEHSAITLSIAQSLIQVIQLNGVTPLVRVSQNDPNVIKQAMDTGAGGVIVPMVNSAQEALAAVRAVKYPPLGIRGVGLARAQGYGMGFEKYKEWVEKESVVIVQVEHIKAVENLEDILKVEGVDGFIVGPYDLSGSIGKPGEFEDREVKSALKKVMQAARKFNKPSGFHVIPPEARVFSQKINEGYKFLAFSLDTLFLGKFCFEEVKKVKQSLKETKK